jgi:hypothetical protein
MNSNLRPAAVAGMFYPESADSLSREIAQMLAAAKPAEALRPKAIVVPHAGYRYSGPIAASAYAALSALRTIVKRIVLLGPTHRIAVNGLALPATVGFSTPLGDVPLDTQAMAAIRALPQVSVSDAAHALEHSLEVQLPFLQMVFDEFSLIPLAVGQCSPESVAEVLGYLWGGDETLIVVSSDLSHYLPYAQAQQLDERTAQRILHLEQIIDHQQACGATPINGLLLAAQRHDLKAQLLDLRNSGDTAGDRSRVVGYASFAFNKDRHDAH